MIFLYIIKWAILYSLLIYFIHYLYLFFEKNLTTTKTIDTLNLSMKEYDKINNILNANNNNNNNINNNININNTNIKKENIDENNYNVNTNINTNINNILPNNNANDNNTFLEFNNDLSIQNELDDFLSKLNTN